MKKGFTLIELLGVIVILGIIGAISVPLVSSMINSSKEDTYQMQVQAIKQGAKNYTAKNLYKLKDCTEPCTVAQVSLKTLKDEGYIENMEIKNPKTGTTYNDTTLVTIRRESGKFKYIFP